MTKKKAAATKKLVPHKEVTVKSRAMKIVGARKT